MKLHRTARRSPLQSVILKAFEGLENRLLFNQTYTPINGSSLSQDWSNPALITTTGTGAWNNVTSFEGYRGVGLSSTSSGDPQFVTTGGTGTEINHIVSANATQANLNTTNASGGVVEADGIADHTVGIAGSGSAPFPQLVAFVNSTGSTSVRVRYRLRDLEDSANDAVQPVALQWRTNALGDWTNVATAFVTDATAGPSVFGPDILKDVTLPAGAANQATLQIRWITKDATGQDEYVGVDDIIIEGISTAGPGTLSLAASTLPVSEAAGTVNFVISRTGGSQGAATVDYVIGGGNATSGLDYTSTAYSGTVNFADGETSKTISVTITDDAIVDPNETFNVTLSNATGAALGTPAQTVVTITDNDIAGTFAFSSTAYSVNEGAGATATITINRTDGSTGAVTVNYSTSNGTATSPGDYTGTTTGSVLFNAGDTTKTFTIAITNDGVAESTENFTITLTGVVGTGAVLGTPTAATITIVDDDVPVPTGLLINEVFIDPPTGSNTPFQYIEIKGAPGTILTNVYVLVIEGDNVGPSSPGQVEGVIDLTGAVIGTNGLLMVASSAGFQKPSGSATNLFITNFFDASETGFETGSETILLAYRDPTGAAIPAIDTDLDSDNLATSPGSGVGTLELLPSNITLLDGVGNSDGGAPNSDLVYAPRLTPLSATQQNAADAIVRFPTNTTPFDTTAYYYGILLDTTGGLEGNQTLTFDQSASAGRRSVNFPSGGIVTPYNVNAPVPSDTTPPTVSSAVFNPAVGQSILVTFSEDVGASLSASDFTLTNTTTNTTVALTAVVAADGKSATLTFSNTGGPKNFILKNGHYEIKVLAGQVADTTGNVLAATSTTAFGFVNGDFNFSGNVNFDDLIALAQNYNGTGKTFANGDANYDGTVNFDDLIILAQNYNVSAPAAVVAAAAPAATSTGKKKEHAEVATDPSVTTPVKTPSKPTFSTKKIG